VSPPRAILHAALAAALLGGAATARAASGRLAASAHAQVRRDPRLPAGACLNCHAARRDGRSVGSPNDLCVECHRTPAPGSSFQGMALYERSAHGGPGAVPWPGPKPPPRARREAGACATCHDPHGAVDGKGTIPAMAVVRGEGLCLACHASAAQDDVAAQFRKPFRHGAASGPRAVACSECHDPHVVRSDAGSPQAPEASARLAGVARVRPANGPAGAQPAYTRVDSIDPSPVLEYEVCFKCHSSAARHRPPGATDLGTLLNPANASFHPVEAQGKNHGIDFRAFTPRWSPDRLVLCSDCHGSDDPSQAGVHGSSERWLLKGRHVPAGPGAQRALPTDLCFRCHTYATYADPAGGAAWEWSRFRLHAAHATSGAVCASCHESHGSPTLPALVATGRVPGMVAFAQTATGGSCVATCHVRTPAASTYVAGYPR
jgi:predicted CXXCH cytochrome family protein